MDADVAAGPMAEVEVDENLDSGEREYSLNGDGDGGRLCTAAFDRLPLLVCARRCARASVVSTGAVPVVHDLKRPCWPSRGRSAWWYLELGPGKWKGGWGEVEEDDADAVSCGRAVLDDEIVMVLCLRQRPPISRIVSVVGQPCQPLHSTSLNDQSERCCNQACDPRTRCAELQMIAHGELNSASRSASARGSTHVMLVLLRLRLKDCVPRIAAYVAVRLPHIPSTCALTGCSRWRAL